MKHIGPPLFARDATGRRLAKVGTVFLHTPGLVTAEPTHGQQRDLWVETLNRDRREAGRPELTEDEAMTEKLRSVDLLFNDQFVLIRPDPYAMRLAFEADELLQTHTPVSKRQIRYLNTDHARVRDALTARGENWRMSRAPLSDLEIERLFADSLVSLNCSPIYYYNRSTGTRFLTLGHFRWIGSQPDDAFRAQLREIVRFSSMRNRFGHLEVGIFPPSCPFLRQAFEALNVEGLAVDALRAAYQKLLDTFSAAVPAELHDETPNNSAWRKKMCEALTSEPLPVVTDEILTTVADEFNRQINWQSGVNIEEGETLFDPVFDELDRFPKDPELRAICDPRARSVLFNYLRELSTIEHINIGSISRSLSLREQYTAIRPNVYVVHVKESDKPAPEIHILRFQKWSIAEHLDTKDWDENRCMMEAAGYIDYVFDRRLACHQLGMSLSKKVTIGRIREPYAGRRQELHGKEYWIVYFVREYIKGCASDKIKAPRYADPEFNRRLARLLGDAAAINLIVGRANLSNKVMFDDGDEVILGDDKDLPERLVVSDNTGSFTNYEHERSLFSDAAAYAKPVNSREERMPNAAEFAALYLEAFRGRFVRTQQEYARRKRAFDTLFKHLPVDPNGSIAYRWQCVLRRLAEADADALTAAIRGHIKVLSP